MGLINHKIPSIPKQKLHEYIWLIAGRNKIGKSTLGSNFPKPYFFTFEPGTSALLTYETNILEKANELKKHPWLVYKKAIAEFISEEGYGFKTVVTDPYGEAYSYCEDYICRREGISSPSDLEWGKGYALVRKEFKSITNQLISNKFTILFITHIDVKNIKDGIGGEKDKVDLDISGKAGDYIRNMVDIFLLAEFDEEGNRKLFVRPTTNKEGGSRLDFGVESIDLNYDALQKAFNEAVKENNKKLGVTDEMIKNYYKDKENKQQLEDLKDKIKSIAKDKGLNSNLNSELMKERIGYTTLAELDNVSKAQEYIDYLENDYES